MLNKYALQGRFGQATRGLLNRLTGYQPYSLGLYELGRDQPRLPLRGREGLGASVRPVDSHSPSEPGVLRWGELVGSQA